MNKQTMTLREVMANRRKGRFAQLLLEAYLNPGIEEIYYTWCAADRSNRARLQTAFPELHFDRLHRWFTGTDRTNERFFTAFPGLRRLDEPMEDPYSFDLTAELSAADKE